MGSAALTLYKHLKELLGIFCTAPLTLNSKFLSDPILIVCGCLNKLVNKTYALSMAVFPGLKPQSTGAWTTVSILVGFPNKARPLRLEDLKERVQR